MTNDEFYRQVAGILGTHYDCSPFPWHKRTRWNNRAPGGGRFPGYGIVRRFGDTVQIALTDPVAVTRTFPSSEEALDFLGTLKVRPH